MAGRTTVVKRGQIEKVVSKLQQLPKKEKEDFALREAIAEMRPEIESVLKRGYSFEEVASFLSDNEIQIKPVTLKQYLADMRRKASKKRSRARSQSNKGSGTASVTENKKKEVSRSTASTAKGKKGDRKRQPKGDGRTVGNFVEMPDQL